MRLKPMVLSLVILILLLFLNGCKVKENGDVVTKGQGLSYPQYKQLVSDAEKNWNLEPFSLKVIRSTIRNPLLIIVEKEMSFGKRNYITLNGETVDPTQEQLIYENEEKGYRLIITWIYQRNVLDNDLLMLRPPEQDINPKVFDSLLSFKNILIHFQILPTGKNDANPQNLVIENGKIIIELNNFLKNYKV